MIHVNVKPQFKMQVIKIDINLKYMNHSSGLYKYKTNSKESW